MLILTDTAHSNVNGNIRTLTKINEYIKEQWGIRQHGRESKGSILEIIIYFSNIAM